MMYFYCAVLEKHWYSIILRANWFDAPFRHNCKGLESSALSF